MTLEPYILEKAAYQRSFNKKEFDIKFVLESRITNEDGLVQVVQTVGEGHLLEILRDHVLSLTSFDMDCWYLLENENYDNIFIPWVYSLSKVKKLLELEEDKVNCLNNNILNEKVYSSTLHN